MASSAPAAAALDLPSSSSTVDKVLCVWDFDWSLVNENSDTWVFDKLSSTVAAYVRDNRSAHDGWTALMDHCLGMLAKEGVTIDDIKAAQHKIPVFPEVVDVIHQLGKHNDVELYVLSDANTLYIEEILTALGLRSYFARIITNPSHIEEDTLRVVPYHTAHECSRCPSNLCKGAVMDEWLKAASDKRVVYIGDGGGDYCAVTRLRDGDSICARTGYRLLKRITTSYETAPGDDSTKTTKPRLKPTLHAWADGKELAAAIRRAIPVIKTKL